MPDERAHLSVGSTGFAILSALEFEEASMVCGLTTTTTTTTTYTSTTTTPTLLRKPQGPKSSTPKYTRNPTLDPQNPEPRTPRILSVRARARACALWEALRSDLEGRLEAALAEARPLAGTGFRV